MTPEISAKFAQIVERLEKIVQEREQRPPVYWRVYVVTCCFMFINYACSCCHFTAFTIEFKGFNNWAGAISILIPELIILFIYGKKCRIAYLDTLLDKIANL